MASGQFPTRRHDSLPWEACDADRAAKAGLALKSKSCLLFARGDWAEYASTLGFPTWHDGMRPCFACNSNAGNMYGVACIELDNFPWRPNIAEDYWQACERCEIRMVLSQEAHQLICPLLKYDKRQTGKHGLALIGSIVSLGLEVGDRLEPSPGLPDIAAIFGEIDYSKRIEVACWGQPQETMTRH